MNSFEKCERVLDDLYTLSNHDVVPVLNRLSLHLGEAKLEVKHNKDVLKSFPMILKFMEKSFDDLVHSFFKDSKVTQFFYSRNLQNSGLEDWNNVFDLLPTILRIYKLLSFSDKVVLAVEDQGIVLKGAVSADLDISVIRKEIYAITRQFLQDDKLLTYKLIPTDSDKLIIEVYLDCSFDKNKTYVFETLEKNGVVIGLPSNCIQYRSSIDSIKTIGNHRVIEISDQLSIRQYKTIPERFTRDLGEREILHFPFIFMPISIIIPKRGKVLPLSEFKVFENTGSVGESKNQNDTTLSTQFGYIDLFALFSK